MKTSLCFLLLTALSCRMSVAQVPGVIPRPVEMVATDDRFSFGPGTVIKYGSCEEKELAEYLAAKTGTGSLANPVNFVDGENAVVLRIDPACGLPQEGYMLDISADSVVICGPDRAGVFYGIQTLLQLAPVELMAGEISPVFTLPGVRVKDWPRFGYRGFSFDVARTFTDADGVKRLLEQMALHKMNRLHWHLTDDEGWRIELESYPRLAAEGGFRGGGSPVRNIYGEWGHAYGGYYTREEIKDIVAYASFLNIEVIPEFDLPGHSRTFARIYPEILCDGPVDSTVAGYDMRKVWCAGKENNFRIIEEIIDELCGLFPGAIIHTGGDEVPPEQWEACPHCRALMEREGIADTEGLNTWFENRVGRMLHNRGRDQGVWNEAVYGSRLDGSAIVYAWETEASVADALDRGYRTVAMPSQYCYFDMKQSANEYGLAWGGIFDVQKVYSYDPVPKGYAGDDLLGIEGAFWTETYLWNGHWWMDYQLFPRICALAERAWTPAEQCQWSDFNRRLEEWHLPRLSALGIGYRGRDGIKTVPGVPSDRIKARYTVTGSVPCTASNPYGNASDGNDRTFARTVRTPLDGDWFEYRFAEPLRCGSVTIKTGYNAIPRFVVAPARLEVSYDGYGYVLVDENFGYTGTFIPESPIHKIRLTVKGEGNGEEAAILYDLIIRP
ncbi:MAG: beta-N-acetylhexosaminidase [Alistipes sp.]|nr:beta-N-acetylhexosaminidase [Alistipes sp.]